MDKEYEILEDVISKCTHDIASEVEYDYFRKHVVHIFPKPMLQRAEGKDRGSYQIMVNICESICKLSKADILKFLDALKIDYKHVFDVVNEEYRRKTGHNLFSDEPMEISSPIEQTTLSPISAPGGLSDVITPVSVISSQTLNTPPAEPVESILTPEDENYVSYGPAVPCPSYQVPEHGNQNSHKKSSGMGRDATGMAGNSQSLNESSESEYSSQTLSSVSQHGCPSEVDPNIQAEPARMKKYDLKIREKPNKVYRMDSIPRGYCCIINNVDFQHFNRRRGSDEDSKNLQMMFEFLGFEVFGHNNKTALEMKNLLNEFAKLPALEHVSALAVAILSHGYENDVIFGIDGAIDNTPVADTFLSKFDLLEIFKGRKCQSMIGKPKLFVLQACRGVVEDTVVTASDSIYRDDPCEIAQFNQSTPQRGSPTRADIADMCFLHSSSLGYKAYRKPRTGSPFVQYLMETVMQNAHDSSFNSIFLDVQNHFSTNTIGTANMSMPEFSSYLTKKLYLNPPEQQQ